MKAIEYMKRIIVEGMAYVPNELAEGVRNALSALGVGVCSGAYDFENDRIVIYVA